MAPGSFAITTTHPLPESADFETVDDDVLEMDGVLTSGVSLLVFGSDDHNVYAVDATDGALVWLYPTHGAVASSPLLFEYEDKQLEPPFDQQPTLLYEVIAHTLEEEVRALRTELHRRLGGELGAVPPEAGDFG